MKFTLRDLFWFVLIIALALGWWLDHRHLSSGLDVLSQHIYLVEGKYPHWNDNAQMIVTDR